MSVVIGVVNQKGGVGKTTTSINIAAGLGTLGKKILLIDFDPQGNSTTGFGIKKKTLDISTYDIIMGNARPQEAIIKTRYKNVDIIPATNQLCEAELQLAGNLRDAMYENIQHFSFSNIDKYSTAGLVTRMTTDVTNVQNAFQMIERMCVRAPVHLVFALLMASAISGTL